MKLALQNPHFPDCFFIQHLPPNMKMMLASISDTEDLRALASLADRISEVATPTVSTIVTSHLSAEVKQLWTEIADLTFLVKSLFSHSNSTSPKRGCSPRCRTHSPAPPTCPTGLCWYYTCFAEKATKGNQPCSCMGLGKQTGWTLKVTSALS